MHMDRLVVASGQCLYHCRLDLSNEAPPSLQLWLHLPLRIRCIRLNDSGELLFALLSTELHLYRFAQGECLKVPSEAVFRWTNVHAFSANGFDVSCDGRLLALCSKVAAGQRVGEGRIRVISLVGNTLGTEVASGVVSEVEYVTAVRFSATTRHVLVGYGIDSSRILAAGLRNLRTEAPESDEYEAGACERGVLQRALYRHKGGSLQLEQCHHTQRAKNSLNAMTVASTFVAEACTEGVFAHDLSFHNTIYSSSS